MLTQDEYKLWTGETVNFDEADWETLVTVASIRLASFLCLESLPNPLPSPLAQLLANFMAEVFKFQGTNSPIEEKRVRNFTIRFSNSSAADAFSQVAQYYGDIIEMYSECGAGFKVEKSSRGCCGCF